MNLRRFRVTNYRNILDSDWICLNTITAFVGQNEAGKSNLFEALYCINPYIPGTEYNVDEDWPVDQWQQKETAVGTVVCQAEFTLTADEIRSLISSAVQLQTANAEESNSEPLHDIKDVVIAPSDVVIAASKAYGSATTFRVVETSQAAGTPQWNEESVQIWARQVLPKFILVAQYDLSGEQVELDQLKTRLDQAGQNRAALGREDQKILIILDLSKVNLDNLIAKGSTPHGRTVRSFDKRSASRYLSDRFRDIWSQKNVKFEIEVDGPTLNIFVEDAEIGMPVRLKRRSTGFRWYVSFAWNFTHASKGLFKNCILLLEEPGIQLHYSAQRDLLETFERLSVDNTIMYTTHLASMIDLANPERVRIVESTDNHLSITHGVVSKQSGPMAVVEKSLGLTGSLSGMLGRRQVLIVEGGIDALIIYKLGGLLSRNGKGLSDNIYLWPAQTATKTPMYAAFAIGQGWDAGVLLDSDAEGREAAKKINEVCLSKLAEDRKRRFRVLSIGKAAGIGKTDAAIEDIFPEEFYLQCVNVAYGMAITMDELPSDGSDMITKRIESSLKSRGYTGLDKEKVLGPLLNCFDKWKQASDLPGQTEKNASELFKKINSAFDAK